jgi:hypothetical protein
VLGELVAEAGVCEGVVSILAADRDVSEYRVVHPGVDKVAVTGSTAAGEKIGALCGNQIRRCSLELAPASSISMGRGLTSWRHSVGLSGLASALSWGPQDWESTRNSKPSRCEAQGP